MDTRAILRFGAGIFLVRRKIVYEAGLADLRPAAPRIPVQSRQGSRDDLMRLSAAEHDYDADAKRFAMKRMLAGDMFTIGEQNGRVVSYGWLMFQQMDMGVGRYLPLAADTAYLYRLFTTESARGQGLSNAYFWCVAQQLAARNLNRVISWMEARNRTSRRVHEKGGFRAIGTIWHVQFLFRTYCFAPSSLRRKLVTPANVVAAAIPAKVAHGA
jgi:L-amino acid N-acyltransferase YncA